MRGNHIQYGRTVEPYPDKTTVADRERIAACELREVPDRKWNREVWKDGKRIGFVRVTTSGQDFKVNGGRKWYWAAWVWGDNDPPWGIAILRLLQRVENSET